MIDSLQTYSNLSRPNFEFRTKLKNVPTPLKFGLVSYKTTLSLTIKQNKSPNFKKGGCHPLLKIDGWISTRATRSNGGPD